MLLNSDNWKQLLENGFELHSSATTGPAKAIFQSPRKLAAANRVAIEAQGLTPQSRVLTVCSMDHAGGVLAQSLPAFSIGAQVQVSTFNAFRFWQDFPGFSHTHLTPAHCRMLMNTHTFDTVDFDGLFVACGSDNVPYDIIDAFVSHGAVFMCNWGMTEIGPIVINTVFDSTQKVADYERDAVASGTLMGDRFYADYKIVNGELWVRGEICVYDDWYNTGDRVEQNASGALYHMGRSQLSV